MIKGLLVLMVMLLVGTALINIEDVEKWVKNKLKDDEPDPTEAKTK